MATVYVSAAGAQETGVMPRFNNTLITDSTFYINENGLAYIVISYEGYPGITSGAAITIQLEKKVLGLYWSTVDIGTPNNTWSYYSSDVSFTHTHTYQLSSKGTYRVKINYTIYGSAGMPDEIEDVLTYKYS